jgi:exosortase A
MSVSSAWSWRLAPWALLPGLVVLLVLFALFRETASTMVGIWYRSETYAHAFLVLPIALWLIWRRRAVLGSIEPRSSPLWLLPMALAAMLWLLGALAGVNAATQFALVALLVLSVPAVFGTAVARELAFPLLFMFFAVPVGEFLTEPMIDRTADFTVAAIRLTGIPVYREGNQFIIPSGSWSVVEACSGVRYLIASFMVGTLFAYLNYRSTTRRLLFVAVSILVPIVANWLRAYMIVMIGHLSGNKLAVGADHLVYGWVFFGIVIMIMFMVGARFSEPNAQSVAAAGDAPARQRETGDLGRTWGVAAAIVLLLAGTQTAMSRLDRPEGGASPVLALPAELPGGWIGGAPAAGGWAPVYANPSATAERAYRSGGSTVTVWIGYYHDQGYDRKLVTSTNALTSDVSDWLPLSRGHRSVTLAGGGSVPMRVAQLRTPSDPKAVIRQRIQTLYVYRIGGAFTTRDAEAKLRLAANRLLGRGDDSAVIFFSAPVAEDGSGTGPLDRFVAEHLARFEAVVDAARR